MRTIHTICTCILKRNVLKRIHASVAAELLCKLSLSIQSLDFKAGGGGSMVENKWSQTVVYSPKLPLLHPPPLHIKQRDETRRARKFDTRRGGRHRL